MRGGKEEDARRYALWFTETGISTSPTRLSSDFFLALSPAPSNLERSLGSAPSTLTVPSLLLTPTRSPWLPPQAGRVWPEMTVDGGASWDECETKSELLIEAG